MKSALGKLAADNDYFDISSLAHNQKPEIYPYPTAVEHLKTAKTVVGADKLIFGSDIPCNLVRDTYEHLVDYIVKPGIFTRAELDGLFYNTAQKIYF